MYLQGGYKLRSDFITEAEQHCLLGDDTRLQQIDCPVRVMHGMKDAVVPYSTSVDLLEALPGDNCRLTLLKVRTVQCSEMAQQHWLLTVSLRRMGTTGSPPRVI